MEIQSLVALVGVVVASVALGFYLADALWIRKLEKKLQKEVRDELEMAEDDDE